MANILEELTKGIASVVGDSDPDAKIINVQSLVDELKKEEEKLFAAIGRKAIEVDGDEKFGEDAVKLRLKQKEIIDAEEKVRIAKEEKEASNKEQTGNTCPGCGIEVAQNIKFCPECGTKLENLEVKKEFCTNCGNEKKEGMKFCINCGNQF